MHEHKVVEPTILGHDRPEICGLMARFEVHPSVYSDGGEYAVDRWKEPELSIEHIVDDIPTVSWKWSKTGARCCSMRSREVFSTCESDVLVVFHSNIDASDH